MRSPGGASSIVVVGGGIVGAFAAYFLARAGVGVTLVEREEIAGQASGNNPGGLNPLYGPGIPGPLQPLALEAFALHLEHWEEIRRTGVEFDGHTKQRLNLAVDDDDVVVLERMKINYDATPGFTARWLEPDEARALEPRLSSVIVRGLLAQGDATVDSAPYTRAVVRAAEAHGASVVAADVKRLTRAGGRVTEVVTDAGSIACDGVVVATGAWCDDPSAWLETSLPMEPVKGEMLLVEVPTGGVEIDVAWRDSAIYHAGANEAWLGGTETHSGFDRSTTAAARESIVQRASTVLPDVASARVVKHTAGLRPLSPDGFPFVGIPSTTDNACVALGGGRKGMLFGAAMGRAAADLLVAGHTDLSVGPCTPERFA